MESELIGEQGAAPENTGRRERVAGWLTAALATLSLLAAGWQFGQPLRGGAGRWLVYVQDDFFYYLQVARNLAAGHGSTFNGLVPTNGYHPLWMLMLAAVCRLGTGERWLSVALMGLTFLAFAATALLTARLLGAYGVASSARVGLALCFAASCLTLFYCGMEITLTLPLLVGVVLVFSRADAWPASVPAGAGVGLLLGATVLSRLDAGLFVALLFAGVLLTPSLRARLRREHVLGVALGLLPVLLYLVSNRVLFDTWMPVSGMAKQIRSTHVPAAVPLGTLFSLSPKALARLLPSVAGFGLLTALRRQLTAAQRVTLGCALGFPLLHVLVLATLSDWLLWPWYLYGVRLSILATLVLLARLRPVAAVLRQPLAGLATVAASLALVLGTRYTPHQEVAMRAVADDLAGFARTHPGVYAMGDRAGIVGYLLPAPLVQTEGLMMDRPFVELLRREAPLGEALARYGVRYYVATVHEPHGACFDAVEPWQAGPTSPHMRGRLCEAPVAAFGSGEFPTLVFDLQASSPAQGTEGGRSPH